MQEIEKISEALFEKIRSRFPEINLGDEQAKATLDPEKARFFNFDYVSHDGEQFGNITISLVDENSLKIYFSKNISEKLDPEQRKEWYAFLYELRKFAKRNLLSFDTRDVSRSNLNIKDLRQVSKGDSNFSTDDIAVTESRLYGTTKHSFENVGSARIRIVHTESVNPEVRGSRARHINAVYVENAQGERFKMESNKLAGARAMARHISEGGAPYDDIGRGIAGMVQEMTELGRFVRSMKNRTFEDNTASTMVEAAASYYNGMQRQLNHIKGPRGYRSFVENFQPVAEQLDEVDVNELKEKFVKKIFDDRMTAALPFVQKAYKLHEQAKQRQIELVKDVIENRMPLQLITNEGMDEYIKALSFSDQNQLIVKVLEDIGTRAMAAPEIAEFAQRWSGSYGTVTESNDQGLLEQQAMAVQLVTHYLRDLRNLRENSELRISEQDISYIDFDKGVDQLDEGTWATPDTTEEIQELAKLLKQPLIVGVDATNATSRLYNLIGDDILFDRLSDLADIAGENADARTVVVQFLKTSMPNVYAKLGLGNDELDVAPAQPTQQATPELAPEPKQAAPKPANEDMDRLLKLSGLQTILVK